MQQDLHALCLNVEVKGSRNNCAKAWAYGINDRMAGRHLQKKREDEKLRKAEVTQP